MHRNTWQASKQVKIGVPSDGVSPLIAEMWVSQRSGDIPEGTIHRKFE